MNLLPSKRLRSCRAWREYRLLRAAMRATPPPVVPDGLKARLLSQTPVSAAEGNASYVSARAWIGWAMAACAFAAAAIWFSLNVPAQHAPGVKPVVSTVTAPRPVPLPRTVTSAHEQQKPDVQMRHDQQTQRTVRYYPAPKNNRPRRIVSPVPLREETVAQEPTLIVSVTRTEETTAGYARVAAYSTDHAGRDIKTDCTLMEDPQAGTSEHTIHTVDDSGQKQMLKVTVLNPHTTPKEMNYESL